jgi:hypothetical protein
VHKTAEVFSIQRGYHMIKSEFPLPPNFVYLPLHKRELCNISAQHRGLVQHTLGKMRNTINGARQTVRSAIASTSAVV